MGQLTVFKSTDANAPAVDGTVGSLISLMSACLVGTSPAYTGGPNAVGWTKPFTGTNKAAFKQGAGSGFYLRVDDNAPDTAKEAHITGYETMTTVDAGMGQFPSLIPAQGVGGGGYMVARKSMSADGVARAWIIVADSRTVYVFIRTGDVLGAYMCFWFGDIYSLLSGDLYNCMLCGRAAGDNSSFTNERCFYMTNNLSPTDDIFFARGYTGAGGSVICGRHTDYGKCVGTAYIGVVPFPNPADGAAFLGRVWVHDPTTTPVKNLRGRLRGIWVPLHAAGSFADGDIVVGAGELTGKTFLMIKEVRDAGGTIGVAAIETSNTVETN